MDISQMAGSDLETRERYATWTWRRRSGEVLPRPTCRGKRPPNGFMWAPTPSQFYWISRIPEVGYMTIWSKSMIVEFEETSAELAAKGIALERLEDQEAPKKCEPWPLLSLPVAACSDRGEDSNASRRSIRGGRIGPMLPLDLGDKGAKAAGRVSHLIFYRTLKGINSIFSLSPCSETLTASRAS